MKNEIKCMMNKMKEQMMGLMTVMINENPPLALKNNKTTVTQE